MLKEIFDPVHDFYEMRLKREKIVIIIVPYIIGIISFTIAIIAKNRVKDGYSFTNDILNQFITIIALFVSFSIANLSLIMTSSSKNVEELKQCGCEKYKLSGHICTLYQIIINEISYLIIIDLILLIFILSQKFILSFFSGLCMKIILSIDIVMFAHVLMITLIMLKDIYYGFWRNR